MPNLDVGRLRTAIPDLGSLPEGALIQVVRDSLYAPYIARQREDIARVQRDEQILLPPTLRYGEISGLSSEVREKLQRIQPATLGHAARIEGMTPAALTLLLLKARQAASQ